MADEPARMCWVWLQAGLEIKCQLPAMRDWYSCRRPAHPAAPSDLMWREIRELGKTKPIIASMADVAASGGYYMVRRQGEEGSRGKEGGRGQSRCKELLKAHRPIPAAAALTHPPMCPPAHRPWAAARLWRSGPPSLAASAW